MTDDTKVIEKLLKKRGTTPTRLKDYSTIGLDCLWHELRLERDSMQDVQSKFVYVTHIVLDSRIPSHVPKAHFIDIANREAKRLEKHVKEYDKAINELHEFIVDQKDTDEELEEIEN